MQTKNTRRTFLKSLAASTIAMPAIIPSSAIGANAPSKRITMGIIGCGNQAPTDLKHWLAMDDVQIIAVCDVNRGSHGYRSEKQFLGREPVRDLVETSYAERKESGTFKGCDIYNDFREILARKDVDTVAIITPDHWHAIQTIQAAAEGKDIYCQKPLGLTVRDGQEMRKAVRKYNRVLQCGSQWRTAVRYHKMRDIVQSGAIGTPIHIIAYVAPNNFEGPGPGWEPMPIPDGFDYDMWLGPVPATPYHSDRCLYRFRFVSDHSGGQTTNFGHHSIGAAMMVVGLDNIMPVEFWNMGAKYPLEGDLFDTATTVHFGCKYESGLTLECVTAPQNFGVKVIGDKGWIEVCGGDAEASDPKLAAQITGNPYKDFFTHYRNFIDCVKSRSTPTESIDVAHNVSSMCHLGNITMKLGRKIRWDGKSECVIDDAEAQTMLAQTLRAPWTYQV